MPGYLYILRCSDDTLYVGSTRDIVSRFEQHSSGRGAQYTRKRLPVTLVYCATFESVSEAYAVERKIHGWSRHKREALIAGRFDLLPKLSKRGYRPTEHRDDL